MQIHFRKDAAGNDAEANVREILSVPDRYRIAGILALGVPVERLEPHTPDDADWDKVHKI